MGVRQSGENESKSIIEFISVKLSCQLGVQSFDLCNASNCFMKTPGYSIITKCYQNCVFLRHFSKRRVFTIYRYRTRRLKRALPTIVFVKFRKLESVSERLCGQSRTSPEMARLWCYYPYIMVYHCVKYRQRISFV